MVTKTIGFIGTGMMGHPMVMRLLNANFPIVLWNRTPEKAIQLIERGAVRASSAMETAQKADVVITMVSDSEALKHVTFGDAGVMKSLKEAGVHIDMSTVAPAVAQQVWEQYTETGKHYIQAPVLGSVPQATDGSLLIFAGGRKEIIDEIQPVLSVLGKRIWTFDTPHRAATIKLACNLFIASMITTLGEALVFVRNAGIDGNILFDILNESALGAPMYQTKGKSLLERNFTPRFMVRHMEKDLTLIRDAAHELGVAMPAVAVIHELFLTAKNKGYGNEDYSAVVKILEEMSADVGRRSVKETGE